jgi:hypothetical protein
MYCPKCAAQIEDTQKFCRACGANVSLVSQALEGRPPEPQQLSPEEFRRLQSEQSRDPLHLWCDLKSHEEFHRLQGTHRKGRRDREFNAPPSIEHAATKVFTGIGFCLAALAVMFYFPGGFTWGMFLFIPGFASLGKGIGQYLQYKHQLQFAPPMNPPPQIVAPTRPIEEVSAPTTSDLRVPGSVTEHTTKHLDSSR